MRRVLPLLLLAAVAAAMTTGIRQDRLFGPDEPREAEIARETLRDGHWVVPRLCALPFLEKPPLYYDLVALAFAAAGHVTPSVARSVSAVFGALMLAAAWLIARRWRGARAAWLAALVLLTMPRFWRYSRAILLDIAVGAFCTCALVCFGWELARENGGRRSAALASLFAFFAACAFLTKGFVAIFTLAAIVLAFCAATRRWGELRRLIAPFPLVIFFAPVCAWLALFYREGGIPYLHEHFVNNIFGRFLQIHFELPGAQFYHTDLGRRLPWYFYLQSLPEILGPWILLLPLATWDAADAVGRGIRSDARFLAFLLAWAFVPVFVFSFSGIKERTYLLPSYSAMALLVGGWLLDRTTLREEEAWREAMWMAMAFPFAALGLASPSLSARATLWIAALLAVPPAAAIATALLRRRFPSAFFPAVAIALGALVVSGAPPVMQVYRRKQCLFELSRETQGIVGDRALYLYRPGDNVRGTIPFHADRTLRELDRPGELREALGGPETTFVILEQGNLDALLQDPSFAGLLHRIPAPAFEADPDNRLVVNREER